MALSCIFALAMSFYLESRLSVDNNLVNSLVNIDPVKKNLFNSYQDSGLFKDKIFIDPTSDEKVVFASAENLALELGYKEVALINPDLDSLARALIPNLPINILKDQLSDEGLEQAAHAMLSMAGVPGGSEFLNYRQSDPFNLKILAASYIQRKAGEKFAVKSSITSPEMSPEQIKVYQSPNVQDFDKIGKLYNALAASHLHFIGADFFAYENYLAIRSDIKFCVGLTLPLTLILFFFFTHSFWLPILLLVGSVISFAAGIGFLKIFFGQVYGVVLAFTSTFVSYNNECLVHFCALNQGVRKRNIIGLSSALGTTLLGFFILLWSDSALVRQTAVISIGANLGFLAFLFFFLDFLETVRFRQITWPVYAVKAWIPVFLSVVAIGFAVFFGMPKIATEVETFGMQSDRLKTEIQYFSAEAQIFQEGEVYAFPIADDAALTYALYQQHIAKFSGNQSSFHPLDLFNPDQKASLAFLNKNSEAAEKKLEKILFTKGIRMNFKGRYALEPVSANEYLQKLTSIAPLPLYEPGSNESRGYLFLPIMENAVPQFQNAWNDALIPMNPKHYYNDLLKDFSQQMGILFLVGVALQTVLLIFLQKSWSKVFYILCPLVVTSCIITSYFSITKTPLNVIHFMGFALVIGVAIDYGAVAVSNHHTSQSLNKILLTGLLSVVSFGLLIFANHPVLKTLGGIVTFGTSFTLAFSLLVKLDYEESEKNG